MKRAGRREQVVELAHSLQAGPRDGRISTADSQVLHEAVYEGGRNDEVDRGVRQIYRQANFTGAGRRTFEHLNRSAGARRAWQVRRATPKSSPKQPYYVRLGGAELDLALLSEFGMAAPGGHDYVVSVKDVRKGITDRLTDGGVITDRELATVEHALYHKKFSKPALKELESIITDMRGEPVFDWERIAEAQSRFSFPLVLQHSEVRHISAEQLSAYENAAFEIANKTLDNPQIQRVEFSSDRDGKPSVLFAFQTGAGQTLLLRLDDEMKPTWRSDIPASKDHPAAFPTVANLSGVKLSVAEAYEKAMKASPHAIWNHSSISINKDGELEFGFWHVSNWLEQPSVTVNAKTGKVSVTDHRRELLDQIDKSGIDVDTFDWRPYGVTSSVVAMWRSALTDVDA